MGYRVRVRMTGVVRVQGFCRKTRGRGNTIHTIEHNTAQHTHTKGLGWIQTMRVCTNMSFTIGAHRSNRTVQHYSSINYNSTVVQYDSAVLIVSIAVRERPNLLTTRSRNVKRSRFGSIERAQRGLGDEQRKGTGSKGCWKEIRGCREEEATVGGYHTTVVLRQELRRARGKPICRSLLVLASWD